MGVYNYSNSMHSEDGGRINDDKILPHSLRLLRLVSYKGCNVPPNEGMSWLLHYELLHMPLAGWLGLRNIQTISPTPYCHTSLIVHSPLQWNDSHQIGPIWAEPLRQGPANCLSIAVVKGKPDDIELTDAKSGCFVVSGPGLAQFQLVQITKCSWTGWSMDQAGSLDLHTLHVVTFGKKASTWNKFKRG